MKQLVHCDEAMTRQTKPSFIFEIDIFATITHCSIVLNGDLQWKMVAFVTIVVITVTPE